MGADPAFRPVAIARPPLGGESLKEDRPMPRFQLKPKCLFVDDLVHKKPEDGDYHPPFPHIMDLRTSPPEYSGLNHTAGLIAHFIVEGVDTDTLLPQIVQSEYGITLEEAAQEVEKVKTLLMSYLEPRSFKRPHHEPICSFPLMVIKILP
jgi:hypothetical protein